MIAGYSAPRQLILRSCVFASIAVALIWAAGRSEIKVDGLGDSAVRVFDILKGFFPPDWAVASELLGEAANTALLGASATLIGLILSIPIGFAAASNISPTWLRLPVRLLLGIERATPEILLLLFFVVAFGLGAFAGIVTLGIASVAMLGKLLGDSIEEADPGVAESVRATGAHRWQIIRYGIIPEIIPALVSNTLFRFEYNMRSTIVLGAVGAGGLGEEILFSISRLHYQRATLAALLSLSLIIAAEQLSSQVCSRWVGDPRK